MRVLLVAAVAASGMLAFGATPVDAAKKRAQVEVMTRNLFLGADLTPALSAQSPQELALRASAILAEVERTDFPTRAKGLAREIARRKPELIGLQEVAHWRKDTEPPVLDGPLTPATTTIYDFLELLLGELSARNAPYEVVAVQQEADLEVPTADGFDGRLTMRDVIIRRQGAKLRTSDPDGANFATNLALQVAGIPITVLRGWTSADVERRGASLKLVNTHLEAFDPSIRAAQAAELVAPGGPATDEGPVILLGDLNTGNTADHRIQPPNTLAWDVLTGAGLIERQTLDFSCCYTDLFDPTETFDHTVDHVMTNTPAIRLVQSWVTGDRNSDRVGGLWPSDHGGVVSKLRFPR